MNELKDLKDILENVFRLVTGRLEICDAPSMTLSSTESFYVVTIRIPIKRGVFAQTVLDAGIINNGILRNMERVRVDWNLNINTALLRVKAVSQYRAIVTLKINVTNLPMISFLERSGRVRTMATGEEILIENFIDIN